MLLQEIYNGSTIEFKAIPNRVEKILANGFATFLFFIGVAVLVVFTDIKHPFNPVSVIVFILVIALFILVRKIPAVMFSERLILSSRRVQWNMIAVNVSKTAILRLSRITILRSSSSEGTTVKRRDWVLDVEQNGDTTTIMRSSEMNLSGIWVALLAQRLSEELQVDVVDNTGVDAFTLLHNGQSQSLKDYLKKQDLKPPSSNPSSSRFKFSNSPNGFFITSKPPKKAKDIVSVVGVLLLMVVFVIEAYAWLFHPTSFYFEQPTSTFRDVGLIVAFILLINIIGPTIRFELGSRSISIRVTGRLFSFGKTEINLSDYAVIHVINLWDNYAVEFVGAKHRFVAPGVYSHEDAVELKNLLESALRSY